MASKKKPKAAADRPLTRRERDETLRDWRDLYSASKTLLQLSNVDVVRQELGARGWEPVAIERILTQRSPFGAEGRPSEGGTVAEYDQRRGPLQIVLPGKPAGRQPDVDAVMDSLSGSFNIAHSLLEALIVKLDPVLRPSQPSTVSAAAVPPTSAPDNLPPPSTPLVSRMVDRVHDLRNLTRMLRDTLERLEV